MAKIQLPTSGAILNACNLLKEGQVVGLPTETVYGLAGSAFSEKALSLIFSVKKRPFFDPLIIHTNAKNLNELRDLIDLNKMDMRNQIWTEKLITRFWPGPLTLLLPKSAKIPDLATAGLDTVAIRSPRHAVARAVIDGAGPVAAPSANLFSRISPTSAQNVDQEIGDQIDLILDGGPCEIGVESTILDLSGPNPQILRFGAITQKQIQECIEHLVGLIEIHPAEIKAPGMLKRHYAPAKKTILAVKGNTLKASLSEAVQLLEDFFLIADTKEIEDDFFSTFPELKLKMKQSLILAEKNEDDQVAARQLFSSLREAEASSCKQILICRSTLHFGLWPAIHERTSKAASIVVNF